MKRDALPSLESFPSARSLKKRVRITASSGAGLTASISVCACGFREKMKSGHQKFGVWFFQPVPAETVSFLHTETLTFQVTGTHTHTAFLPLNVKQINCKKLNK